MLKQSISRRSFLSGLAGASFATQLGYASSRPLPNVSGDASLRFHAISNRLLYGAAVNAKALRSDVAYARLLREQCAVFVPENCMKWRFIEPKQGQFTFQDADFLVSFAEREKIKMRGHTLVWHKHVPEWATQSNATGLMKEHIHRMMSRYAGHMHSWDVVNEAIDPKDGRPDGLRKSKWLELAGDNYIEEAYRAARLADPTALLTYNDYGIEGETHEAEQRRIAMLLLLRRLRARNVPIDAVGIQSHLTAGHEYGPSLRRFLASIRELDLQVFITELDVNDSGLPQDVSVRDKAVAETYRKYLEAVLPEPAVKAVLTWGITLKYSWLQQENKNPEARGLPFDANYMPTPAFEAMKAGFDGKRASVEGTFEPFRLRG